MNLSISNVKYKRIRNVCLKLEMRKLAFKFAIINYLSGY